MVEVVIGVGLEVAEVDLGEEVETEGVEEEVIEGEEEDSVAGEDIRWGRSSFVTR